MLRLYIVTSSVLLNSVSRCGHRLPVYLMEGESWLQSMAREVYNLRRDEEGGSHWFWL